VTGEGSPCGDGPRITIPKTTAKIPMQSSLVLTWLYVPGDRPDRFDRAADSGADVVVVDLEDAVPASAKSQARTNVLSWLLSTQTEHVEVRVNRLRSPWGSDDLAALCRVPNLRSVRLPKVESGEEVVAVADALPSTIGLHCLIESARGVEAAFEIATSSPRVTGIGLGEADLRADLGISSLDGMDWIRSRLVVAARAAGLPSPAMAAYTDLSDLEGLASSCRSGRALGMLGRSALHPRQIPVIVDAFLPDPDEVRRAQQIAAAAANAMDSGGGVFVLPNGGMVDAAVLAGAHRILDLAKRSDSKTSAQRALDGRDLSQ
jgi:citrate lyase subunit beta/citryl-CoA lyase